MGGKGGLWSTFDMFGEGLSMEDYDGGLQYNSKGDSNTKRTINKCRRNAQV